MSMALVKCTGLAQKSDLFCRRVDAMDITTRVVQLGPLRVPVGDRPWGRTRLRGMGRALVGALRLGTQPEQGAGMAMPDLCTWGNIVVEILSLESLCGQRMRGDDHLSH